jgi:Uma2 family endonuclease
VVNPIVLVEVLSESSEAYDRGAKAAHYRRIPTLREYVLVAQDEPRIEIYRRNERGRWELFEARPGASVELESLGIQLDVSAVYDNPLASKSP